MPEISRRLDPSHDDVLVDLESLVRDAQSLKPLPASATRLADLLAREDWDMGSIAEVVRLDQALTGRLLSTANSALSGARRAITSVDQAIMRMGPGMVLSLAIGSSVKKQMDCALPQYGLSEGALWRHSISAALAMSFCGSHCRISVPPHAFAAALLHDVGKLVLARHLNPAAMVSLQRIRELGSLSEDEAEKAVLRIGHAQLGGLVARSWKLPECIVRGIRHHHNPLAGPHEADRKLCYLIALGDAVATHVDAACSDGSENRFNPAIAGSLGMSLPSFEELCLKVRDRLDEVLAVYA